MRYGIYLLLVALTGCGGTLSDEQKKKIREEMELNKIRRVSEAEITEAAFARGRYIISMIATFNGDSLKIDSLIKAQKGAVRWVVPGQSTQHEMEKQLIDAYIASATGGQQDNVQKIRTAQGESDSLLYSKPVLSALPDGTGQLQGVWNIWLSKKQLILSIDK